MYHMADGQLTIMHYWPLKGASQSASITVLVIDVKVLVFFFIGQIMPVW